MLPANKWHKTGLSRIMPFGLVGGMDVGQLNYWSMTEIRHSFILSHRDGCSLAATTCPPALAVCAAPATQQSALVDTPPLRFLTAASVA